ncbi:MAG: trimethylamine methyltransferase [Gammaproteobacteria bacterium]|nr:trimethylamine methyltransferase [Gammaproteobacteria bacterium]
MTEEKRRPRRQGGRANRQAVRSDANARVNPSPPGQTGGQYQPLTPAEITAIYDTALRLLSELGMGETPRALQEQCVLKGATLNATRDGQTRVLFPRSMVEDIIAGAAHSFIFYGRDPKYDFEIGGNRVYFGTGGAAVQTLDLDSHWYRPSTLRDLYDFARLVDTLENVSWFTRCCVATDLPDIRELDINTAYALLKGTNKPLGTSITLAENVDPIIDMFDIASGGEGTFRARPFCKIHISPVISPMRYGEDAVAVALAAMRRGAPINCITAAQSGATAPAPLAGFLAQSLAETLASLIMVNVFAPGYPMIFSNWPFVIDLRTGSFCGGGGEISVMNAASAQLSNFLNLPSGVASSMADAKAVDAQMGSEKALAALAAGLAGGNMVYESCGMMASLLGVSFEAFVLDNEMLSHVQRMVRGIEVNEETLGFDAICEAVLGEGHFLGAGQTMAAMQRDYFYPKLADRDDPTTWEEGGAKDSWQRAGEKARAILAAYHPSHLDVKADGCIRAHLPIRLTQ